MSKENDDWRRDYKAPPGKYLILFKDWELDTDVFDSEMSYSCRGTDFDTDWKCDKVTGLRLKIVNTPGVACCSFECKQLILKNNETSLQIPHALQ